METKDKILYNPFSYMLMCLFIYGAMIGAFTLVFSLYVLAEGIGFNELFTRYMWWHKLGLILFIIFFPISLWSYIKEKKLE